MNLKFLYLSKKHANRTPTFGNSSGIEKTAEGGSGTTLISLAWKEYLFYGNIL